MNGVTEFEVLTGRTNILVVDDRPDGLLALEAVLAAEEYAIVKASSGREALHHCLYHDFAVILLDVQMPELDGFETARLLRNNYRSKETPIIFVTAINKETRHVNQGYESGAVDYIFKPLDPFVLKAKVDIFVDLFKKNEQIKQQAAMLREVELQEKERQLLELKQEGLKQYAHLADAIPHIVLKVNTQGHIEYFNDRWLQYTALKSDVNWAKLIHQKDKRRFLLFWLRLQRQNLTASQIEVRLRDSKGVFNWHLIRVVAELKDNQPVSWVCTCTDIDKIKKAEEEARNLSQELNRSNKELEEFAYIASHDLKEPLHVISSFVFLLERRLDGKLDGQEREYLKFIKHSVQQAQRLIRELLEYSCTGREKSFQVIDLAAVLNQALINLKVAAEESGARIHFDPMPKIKANYMEMVQLFQNLIENAIKYRSQEPCRIYIGTKVEYDRWVFSIKDNGIGIDPQFKERIFGMFQRLHPKSEYSGTGVGLAICKKIVENHAGKIWVESQPKEGATFYFTVKRNL